MEHREQEAQLTNAYQQLFATEQLTDVWMKLPPAVPFVGKDYGRDVPKVLIYGSAENLMHLTKGGRIATLEDAPIDRNMKMFEQWKAQQFGTEGKSKENFFPWVHMSPVSDGTLPTVTRYLLEGAGETAFAQEPDAFLQQIAVVNYGKFSLKGGRNSDYASKPEFLKFSEPYVLKDLEILQPDIVILPRSIQLSSFDEVLKQSPHRPKMIWPVFQTNAGVINRHVRKQLNKVGVPEGTQRPAWIERWLDHIPAAIKLRTYLDWLDWRTGIVEGSKKRGWTIELKEQVMETA